MAFEIENGVLMKYKPEKGETEAVIPESVTSIGGDAFSKCCSLTSVTIPNSVTEICNSAFNGCKKLTTVTISDSVTMIGDYAFRHCSSLTAIKVNDNNKNYSDLDGVLFDKNKKILIQYPCRKTETSYTIPDSVTVIGSLAFRDCKKLIAVTIPESVTTIGYRAFQGCSVLNNLILNEGLQEIEAFAFEDCKALTSVVIPKSVKKLGMDAFPKKLMQKKKMLAKKQENPRFEIEDDCLFTYNEPDEHDFEGKLDGYDGFDEYLQEVCGGLGAPYPSWSKVRIPKGKGITTIGAECFGECWSIAIITIPEGVTAIEDRAFYRCFYLNRITIPESVEEIGSMIFDECYDLRTISFVKNGKKVKFQFDYSEYEKLKGKECETQMNLLTQFITAKTKEECEKIISQITIDRVKDELTKILNKSFGK